MPRWDGFARSLAFAACAAAGLPVAVTFAGLLFGGAAAARLYLIAAAGIYASGLSPDRSRRVAALAFGALAGAVLALLPLDLRATAIGAAGIVGFARSALIAQTRSLRGIAIEIVLGATGLAVAAHFARGGLFALCLALWGYFLIQSGYFLIGGRAADAETERDPFDRARERLLRLLEDDRV
jgi:hypothetical protein